MDDFDLTSLSESRNEWVSRLVTIMTPNIVEGFKAIFTESYKLCIENDENEKYLMTFQNFISRIPKWNDDLINQEVERIIKNSNCGYLEDLITCVHIIQLKALTCIRVGQKQKKVDIDIPRLKDFIHKSYIHVARKLYSNIFLFEKDIPPLEIQKNSREFEIIVKEAILNSIRESIPVEQILRSYLDETTEEDVEVEESIIEENNLLDNNSITRDVTEIENDPKDSGIVLRTNDNLIIDKQEVPIRSNLIETLDDDKNNDILDKKISISFDDKDTQFLSSGKEEIVSAPKTLERLEEIASNAAEKRKLEEMEDLDDSEDIDKIKIGEQIKLDDIVEPIDKLSLENSPPVLLGEITELN